MRAPAAYVSARGFYNHPRLFKSQRPPQEAAAIALSNEDCLKRKRTRLIDFYACDQFLQLALLIHLDHDVAATYELPVYEKLGECWPV